MKYTAKSLVEVESLDGEERVIRGIATTPRPDRVGDIVEPLGVKVASDIPLFLYHDHHKTVGRAKFGRATAKGIPFEAYLPKIEEIGILKDRVDEAWQMVKYNLITAVSIGFRAVHDKIETMKGGGLRFIESEVLELSLVPVPAQPDAVIQTFKSMPDDEFIRLFADPNALASAGIPREVAQPAADDSGHTKRRHSGAVKIIPRK